MPELSRACRNGHVRLENGNLVFRPNGKVRCRQCARDSSKRQWENRKWKEAMESV